jgi:hypothetical protein
VGSPWLCTTVEVVVRLGVAVFDSGGGAWSPAVSSDESYGWRRMWGGEGSHSNLKVFTWGRRSLRSSDNGSKSATSSNGGQTSVLKSSKTGSL